jgi:DNA-binding LacI/PurR family transcriptional regulator
MRKIAWIEPFADADEVFIHPVQRRMLAGAMRRTKELGLRLERFQTQRINTSPESLRANINVRGIDGVVLLPRPLHLRPVDPLDLSGFACVSLGRAFDSGRMHTVVADVAGVMRGACRGLHALGYRRVGCMLPHFVERLVEYGFSAGYFGTMGAELRSEVLPILYGYGDDEPFPTWSVRRGGAPAPLARDSLRRDDLAKWLKETRPDAVISTHREAINALQGAGLRVPDDLGFADLSADGAEPADTRLAGVDQKFEELAATAIDVLVVQLERGERGLPKSPRTTTLPSEWVTGVSVRSRETREETDAPGGSPGGVSRVAVGR